MMNEDGEIEEEEIGCPGENEPVTLDNLVKYLVFEYDLEEAQSREIIEKHSEIFEKGKLYGSFTYFVGDEMMGLEVN